MKKNSKLNIKFYCVYAFMFSCSKNTELSIYKTTESTIVSSTFFKIGSGLLVTGLFLKLVTQKDKKKIRTIKKRSAPVENQIKITGLQDVLSKQKEEIHVKNDQIYNLEKNIQNILPKPPTLNFTPSNQVNNNELQKQTTNLENNNKGNTNPLLNNLPYHSSLPVPPTFTLLFTPVSVSPKKEPVTEDKKKEIKIEPTKEEKKARNKENELKIKMEEINNRINEVIEEKKKKKEEKPIPEEQTKPLNLQEAMKEKVMKRSAALHPKLEDPLETELADLKDELKQSQDELKKVTADIIHIVKSKQPAA